MADEALSLKIASDKASINDAIRGLNRYSDGIDTATKATKALDAASVAASKRIRDAFDSRATSRLAEVAKVAKQGALNLDDLRKSALEAGKATANVSAAQRFKTATEQQGDISTTFGALSGLAGGSPALSLIGDLSGVAEYLPRFKDAITGLPNAALQAASAIGIGGVGLVGAFAGVAAGAAIFEAQLAGIKKELDAAVTANQRYYELLGSGATTEDATKRLEDLQREIENQRDELASIENAYASNFEGNSRKVGDAGARVVQALLNISSTDDKLTARADELKVALSANEAEAARLTTEIKNDSFARNDDTAAAERETESINKLAAAREAALQQQIRNETEVARLIREGTSKTVEDRIQAIRDEQNATLGVIASGKASAQEAIKLGLRLAELGNEARNLETNVLPLIQLREAENKAIEDGKRIREQSVSAVARYNEDLKRLDETRLKSLADAQARYNKSLVDIAQQASKAASDALKKLREARDNLARDFARGEADAARQAQLDRLDLQINVQREEARALRDHYRDIEQIQRDAQRSEEDLIANRDFAGLFRLRRDTGRQIEDANRNFVAERQERLTAYAQQQADLIAQFQRDREARLIKYQQDIADAQAAYAAERQQIEASRREAQARARVQLAQDLQLAQQKYTQEIKLRQQAITQELQMIAQGESAKLALENQYWQQSLNLVRQAIGAVSGVKSGGGGGKKGRAFGGVALAGQSINVNEPMSSGFERFRAGGRSFALPGAGVFIPSRSGTVDANRGGTSVNFAPVFNVSGGNAKENVREIERMLDRKLEEYFPS
jgi:hypothetical protein